MEFLCQSKFEKRASLWGIAKMHKNGTFCTVQGHRGRLTQEFRVEVGHWVRICPWQCDARASVDKYGASGVLFGQKRTF